MSIPFLRGSFVRGASQSSRCIILILAAVVFLVPATADGQVRETPNRWIRGVAKVTLDQNGKSKISFNPQRCRELGPELCEFFRTHEYGHVNLRHLERGVDAPQAEAEADLWAARHASPTAVRAAKAFFLSGQGGSRVHGTPQERARRMDAGQSSSMKNPESVGSKTRPSVTPAKRRGSKSASKTKLESKPIPKPKSYSATSKKRVRYRVKPSQTASTTTRHVVRTPPKVSQPSRRTSSGYVPRGDFLNPR